MKFKRIAVLLAIVTITLVVSKFYGHIQLLTKLESSTSLATAVLPKTRDLSLNSHWTRLNYSIIQHQPTDSQWTFPAMIEPHLNHSDDSTASTSVAHLSNTSTSINPEFTVSEEFRFPHPKAMKVIDILHRSSWILELKSTLKAWMERRRIIMVTSNSAYKEILVNWLLSAVTVAHVSVKQILVVALDEIVWHLLKDRGINSVFVPPSSLFDKSLEVSGFGQIMMTRISIIRLLNHWGYDVAMVDTDALLLKDPWTLFEQFPNSDIVASMGSFPSELSSQWGTSLCVGVILIRSSNQTEEFWKETGKMLPTSYSDQERINYGLKTLSVEWHSLSDGSFEGRCVNGLKVKTLSYSQVCRRNCNRNRLSTYHIWHKSASRDGQSKKKAASQSNVWLLSPQWNFCNNLMIKQEPWLKCIHV